MVDGIGITGMTLHYSMAFAFFGSALLVFLYLWRKGGLSFSEEVKYQMMDEE